VIDVHFISSSDGGDDDGGGGGIWFYMGTNREAEMRGRR
jgi:hypothetical protein